LEAGAGVRVGRAALLRGLSEFAAATTDEAKSTASARTA